MRLFGLFLGLILFAPLAQARTIPLRVDSVNDPIVPLELGGLRLHALDEVKILQFQIGGRLAEIEVPILVYVPEESETTQLAQRLRRLSNMLATELTRPDIDRVAVRRVAEALDREILNLLGD